MTEQHLTLCQQIIDYCQQRQWYGPDQSIRYRGYVDEQGKLQERVITHDRRIGFEFPPATAKQLQDTEKALGFPLPPMLRALYTHVANGGFGPAYGLTGASGGYYFGEDGHYQTLALESLPETYSGPLLEVEPLNLAEYEHQHGDPLEMDLPPNTWPDHFLQICYLGCGMEVGLDGVRGRVYRIECGLAETEDGFMLVLHRLDNSLEHWLESWLVGNPHL